MGYSTYCSDWCIHQAGHDGPHEFRQPQVLEAVERIRSHHDRTMGHGQTNVIGYCAEPDGISAAYCEVGVLLQEMLLTGVIEFRSAAPRTEASDE